MNSKRIEYLDGLRGVAILLVIGYHAFVRWPALVPYGDSYAQLPLFRFGYLGVQLFFLISGFVILMTLERCQTGGDFLWRRWFRLFPAMAICTAIIFASAGYFHERPMGQPSLLSIVPGLLFVEPGWIQRVVGVQFPLLEGAFWSIFVEFKFYVIAAVVHFVARRGNFSTWVFALFAVGAAAKWGAKFTSLAQPLWSVASALSLAHFAFFAAGAEFYLYTKGGKQKHLRRALLMGCLGPLGFASDIASFAAAMCAPALFAVVVCLPAVQMSLGSRPLIFVGFISYPLYLLHENMMIAAVTKMAWLPIPGALLPVAAVAGIGLVAYAVATSGEPALRKLLQLALGGARRNAMADGAGSGK